MIIFNITEYFQWFHTVSQTFRHTIDKQMEITANGSVSIHEWTSLFDCLLLDLCFCSVSLFSRCVVLTLSFSLMSGQHWLTACVCWVMLTCSLFSLLESLFLLLSHTRLTFRPLFCFSLISSFCCCSSSSVSPWCQRVRPADDETSHRPPLRFTWNVPGKNPDNPGYYGVTIRTKLLWADHNNQKNYLLICANSIQTCVKKLHKMRSLCDQIIWYQDIKILFRILVLFNVFLDN